MIRLENVHLSFGEKDVLRGISLSFPGDDRLVILGESGIGKSTILKVILGLLRPNRGRVLLDGKDIHLLSERELTQLRKSLAVVFQGGALFDSMTVGENVGYRLFEEGKLSAAEIEAHVRDLLVEVGLEDAIDLFPAELSGGMRKRAALARAIAANPRYILFDEPTAGLDPVASFQVNQLILRCQKNGKATVVVTHDLECAFRVGGRLMLIHDGRIVFEGDREALENSGEPSVRRFLNPAETLASGQRRES
ncbi:MAG: ATP-binding cassette domain-containing protein [Desulfuromonadales bacterium]|jgi:phospholipid/cholesterol/gamma-HCH transport system ATP-binding protein